MADQLAWVDGRLVPEAEAVVSAFDVGFTLGDGVYETLKAIDGRAFAVRRHLERLRRSAQAVAIEVPWTDDELRSAIDAVTAGRGPLARVRITVTGGPAPLGPFRGEGRPTVVVAAGAIPPPDPTLAVCTVDWARDERSPLAGVKSTSIAASVRALARARAGGFGEAILPNHSGRLCEGTATNVFAVLDGIVRTPPLSSGCLAGVTRALVCEVVEVREEDLPYEALAIADEVFVTSTTRDVQAVHRIDDRELAAPGPATSDAAAAFAALCARDLDP